MNKKEKFIKEIQLRKQSDIWSKKISGTVIEKYNSELVQKKVAYYEMIAVMIILLILSISSYSILNKKYQKATETKIANQILYKNITTLFNSGIYELNSIF